MEWMFDTAVSLCDQSEISSISNELSDLQKFLTSRHARIHRVIFSEVGNRYFENSVATAIC